MRLVDRILPYTLLVSLSFCVAAAIMMLVDGLVIQCH